MSYFDHGSIMCRQHTVRNDTKVIDSTYTETNTQKTLKIYQ